MFANIFQPLIDVAEAILLFYHDTVGVGWGWAIVFLTMTVRLAILPLTFKQVRSMQEMQRLQPQMKELQERYKDDRQRMNQELMALYQEHQVNPLGSCLPLLLQLPFFLALFYLQQSEAFRALVRDTGGSLGVLGGGGNLDTASQVTGGEKFLFIPDLTVPATGGVLVVLILIYICTQLGSSTVSAMAMTDKNQKRLMFALPFIFVPFIISFPAGLLVYWITTNLWTVGQQVLIRMVLPPPHLKEREGPAEDAGLVAKIKHALGAGASPPQTATAKATTGGGGTGGTKAKATAGGAGTKTKAKPKSGDGSDGGKRGKSSGSTKQADGSAGAAKTPTTKREKREKRDGSGGDGAKAEKKSTSSDGDNGRGGKAPPRSPRKKKKRSGRRR